MTVKVLVVDDSRVVRQLVKRALPATEFVVVEAGDGVEALECLDRHTDLELIIADVNMPRLGGLDLLDELRKRPAFASIHVMMLTTEAAPTLVARAKAAGAKAWLLKPWKADILLSAVTRVLQSGPGCAPPRAT